jgi:hypothetical protein
MDGKIGRLDKNIRPNASHQFLITDELTWAFKQNDQDFQSATAEGHWLVALQEKKLRREQAKRTERNLGWRAAGRFGAFLEDRLARIRTLNGASHVKSQFETRFRQRWRPGAAQVSESRIRY